MHRGTLTGRVMGVDVAARRGLDAVLLDTGRTLLDAPRRLPAQQLAALVEEWSPDIVAVDAPCRWALDGTRSRAAERALLRMGIHSYFTPCAAYASGAFYDWVRTGMLAYDACLRSGLRLYAPDHDGSAPTVCEVFPHASVVALLGAVPRTRSRREKEGLRRRVLVGAGVDDAPLRNLDEVDAALAALTGVHLALGCATAVGDVETGVIVLPTGALPARYGRGRQNAGGA